MDTRLLLHATASLLKREVKHADPIHTQSRCGVRHFCRLAKSKNDCYARVTFASDSLPSRLPRSGEAAGSLLSAVSGGSSRGFRHGRGI